MNKTQIALKTIDNPALTPELAKLYLVVDEYCKTSENGKLPVSKGVWQDVVKQHKRVKKELGNE